MMKLAEYTLVTGYIIVYLRSVSQSSVWIENLKNFPEVVQLV